MADGGTFGKGRWQRAGAVISASSLYANEAHGAAQRISCFAACRGVPTS
ncbi:hypothetical protein [uncultured Mitsuokella sp.]|nr:hypothetical protein [uncultured Mitsuokella sp.]